MHSTLSDSRIWWLHSGCSNATFHFHLLEFNAICQAVFSFQFLYISCQNMGSSAIRSSPKFLVSTFLKLNTSFAINFESFRLLLYFCLTSFYCCIPRFIGQTYFCLSYCALFAFVKVFQNRDLHQFWTTAVSLYNFRSCVSRSSSAVKRTEIETK